MILYYIIRASFDPPIGKDYNNMDIYAKLKDILSKQIKKKSFDIDSVTPETPLSELGLDSLDTAELVISIEEEFDLPEFTQEEMISIVTIKDIKELIEKKR